MAGAVQPADGPGPADQLRLPLIGLAVLAVIVLAISHRLWLWDYSKGAPKRDGVSRVIG